jgi:hypothetical protein
MYVWAVLPLYAFGLADVLCEVSGHPPIVTGKQEQDRLCTCKCNFEARLLNHCCRGQGISNPVIYSQCLSVALVIQHARRFSKQDIRSILKLRISDICILNIVDPSGREV